jgi:hypothetical protein
LGWFSCSLCLIFGGNKMIDYLASFINTDGASFPDTKAVNVTAPGAGDGTEFVELLVNDIWGRAQALMDYAGLTPDGVTEAPDTAQFLEALAKGYAIGPGIGVTYWKSGTPIANGDRVLLLQGQVILISSYPLLVAAIYCGDANNATAPAFYKTSDAGGTTRSTSGTYLVLPDLRGLSLKNIGDATVNGRTKVGPVNLGEVQEDQFQGHYFRVRTKNLTGTNSYPRGGDSNGNTSNGLDAAWEILTDGTNGPPRIGTNTRDSSIGTNFAITY